jgi:hypothetical protein
MTTIHNIHFLLSHLPLCLSLSFSHQQLLVLVHSLFRAPTVPRDSADVLTRKNVREPYINGNAV